MLQPIWVICIGKDAVRCPYHFRKLLRRTAIRQIPMLSIVSGKDIEEGWTGAPDLHLAMFWYKKAAQAGHHLALKRLSRE